MSGKFITFEGGEGGGKSTQARLLADALKKSGIDVVVTREPGGSPEAEDIRALLVSGSVDRWTPMAEVLLNYAARAMHVKKTVEPALARGAWVISDRFADSTMAYQGFGGGVDKAAIEAVHGATLGAFMPDLTIILDLPTDQGLSRAGKRIVDNKSTEDRYERMGRDFHQRLRDGFLEIARSNSERCHVIDAGNVIEVVSASVRDKVTSMFGIDLS